MEQNVSLPNVSLPEASLPSERLAAPMTALVDHMERCADELARAGVGASADLARGERLAASIGECAKALAALRRLH